MGAGAAVETAVPGALPPPAPASPPPPPPPHARLSHNHNDRTYHPLLGPGGFGAMRGPVPLPRRPGGAGGAGAGFPGGRVAGARPRGARGPPPGLPVPVPPPEDGGAASPSPVHPLRTPEEGGGSGGAAAHAPPSSTSTSTPPRSWLSGLFAPDAEGDAARNVKLAVAGGVAGAVSRTATAPLDR
jgi:hypothetical protein